MPATPITRELARSLLPLRPSDGHKGTFGHVFVLAGSRGFTGAAKLACEAAGRSGAGLVTLGIPRPLGDIAAVSLLEAMSLLLPATEAETFSRAALEPALAFCRGKQAVAIGPGISQHAETGAFVLDFLSRCELPVAADADALNALAARPEILAARPAVTLITPHPGEMSRLCGIDTTRIQSDRTKHASEFAARYRCTVVLKGAGTIVAAPDGRLWCNTTGNAGLATGGTGDVLTGLLGGLLAQGMNATDAAILGVYAHGLAGDIAARLCTERGMLARDVLRCIPDAWAEIEA